MRLVPRQLPWASQITDKEILRCSSFYENQEISVIDKSVVVTREM